MTNPLTIAWHLSAAAAGAHAQSTRTVLTSPARGGATVAAGCPVLSDAAGVVPRAIFANLTP
ncbi:hypothetical protein [Ferrimicrobium acidiphilum]|uniref:Uncharacterized protein n=1 Tax=Ferrimicrobium acidiphilum TaxID=121039 RepID=A0ABV3Y976_9ACTN